MSGRDIRGGVVYVAPAGTALPTGRPEPGDGWSLLGYIEDDPKPGVVFDESLPYVGPNAWGDDTFEFTVRSPRPWTLLEHTPKPVLIIYPPGRRPCDDR